MTYGKNIILILLNPFMSYTETKESAKSGFRFAESIPRRERAAVKAYVVEIAMYHVPEKLRATEATFIERNLHVISQEKSSALFRENFTLSSRHLISSSTKQVSSFCQALFVTFNH